MLARSIIGFEDSLAQVHQDFADCAQTKPMAASIKSTYDTRDRAASAARAILQGNPWLMDHVDGTAAGLNVSATSPHIFTLGPSAGTRNASASSMSPTAPSTVQDDVLTAFWGEILASLGVFTQLVSGASPSDVRHDQRRLRLAQARRSYACWQGPTGTPTARGLGTQTCSRGWRASTTPCFSTERPWTTGPQRQTPRAVSTSRNRSS